MHVLHRSIEAPLKSGHPVLRNAPDQKHLTNRQLSLHGVLMPQSAPADLFARADLFILDCDASEYFDIDYEFWYKMI